jgi:predicted DNA-binding transcriptional regulator YafY
MLSHRPMTAPSDPSEDAAPRWGVERRLAFIAGRLSWERRINRADLVARFGVSPNQATADLRRFADINPGALIYDTRSKVYRAGPAWTRPDAADTATLLRDLRLVAEGVMTADGAGLAEAPAMAVAEPPVRDAPPAVLLAVVTAIRDGRALQARYQSFSTPEPRVRTLEPHALVFDGFRWHARARDVEEDRFKDFVLGRLSGATDAGAAGAGQADDVAWNTMVELEIRPHPGLSQSQRAAVEADYAMSEGRTTLTCREAVVYYVKRRLGLTEGHEFKKPEDQHVILTAAST